MAKKDTITRAVEFPVAYVHEASWQDFLAAMHELWRGVTDASNWAVRRYASIDNPVRGEDGVLPPCPKLYAYPELVKLFPHVGSQTLAAVSRATESQYRRHRTAVLHGREALPCYDYPAPYPVRADRWQPTWATGSSGQRPGVTFAVGQQKHKTLRHWTLVLRGGPEFSRQVARFRQIVSGEAKQCELQIYRKRAGSTHRNGDESRGPGGENRSRFEVCCKLVAHFPKQPAREAEGYMALRTDAGCFWQAMIDGRVVEPWRMRAHEVRRWLARSQEWQRQHAAAVQGIADDMKLERRVRVGSRKQMGGALDVRCEKHRRRMRTWVQQAAAQVCGYACRRGCAGILYDDTDRGWCETFPWFQVRQALRTKCEELGLEAGGALCLADAEPEAEEVAEAVA